MIRPLALSFLGCFGAKLARLMFQPLEFTRLGCREMCPGNIASDFALALEDKRHSQSRESVHVCRESDKLAAAKGSECLHI